MDPKVHSGIERFILIGIATILLFGALGIVFSQGLNAVVLLFLGASGYLFHRAFYIDSLSVRERRLDQSGQLVWMGIALLLFVASAGLSDSPALGTLCFLASGYALYYASRWQVTGLQIENSHNDNRVRVITDDDKISVYYPSGEIESIE